jgi:hypothetical protein
LTSTSTGKALMPFTAADKTRASIGGYWATSEQIVKMTLARGAAARAIRFFCRCGRRGFDFVKKGDCQPA